MADLLATPADLASLLQQDLDTSTATLLLELATAAVQGATGQRLVQVVGDTATIWPTDPTDQWITLPQRPVTVVASAQVGTTPVTDWILEYNRLYRFTGWYSALAYWPRQPNPVTVTYTHGWATGAQELQLARQATLALAAGAYTASPAVTAEQIDDYRVQFAEGAGAMSLTPFLRDALTRRYGRPVATVRLNAHQRMSSGFER